MACLKVLVVCLLTFSSTDSAGTKGQGHYFITFFHYKNFSSTEVQCMYKSIRSLFRHLLHLLRRRSCSYTMGIIQRGCGRETDKARGTAECLIRSRDHILIQ